MPTQIIYIHGGQAYSSYDAYRADLERFTVDPYVEKKRWKNTLQSELTDEFEVIFPEMPNKLNAHYEEWRVWFEKYVPFLRDGVVLIGHSLGAMFLVRYLSQNALPVALDSVYLVATPFPMVLDAEKEDGGDFNFNPEILQNLKKIAKSIVFIHSEDDMVVPISQFYAYKEVLPESEYMSFADRGHFLQETFPELTTLIAQKAR